MIEKTQQVRVLAMDVSGNFGWRFQSEQHRLSAKHNARLRAELFQFPFFEMHRLSWTSSAILQQSFNELGQVNLSSVSQQRLHLPTKTSAAPDFFQ